LQGATGSPRVVQSEFAKPADQKGTMNVPTLLEPFLDRDLTARQLDQISIYIDLLLRWNARINLTAIRTPEEILTRHFGESFFLARHVFPQPLINGNLESNDRPATDCHPERSERHEVKFAESKDPYPSYAASSEPQAASHSRLPTAHRPLPAVLDLGSGAGFPALPIKIWAPQIHLTMIESNHKKATFLREVARTLILTNVNVIAERAQTIEGINADVVTFRAVERFDQILRLAARFLAPRGRLALLIGSAQLQELAIRGFPKWETIPVPQSKARVLVITKVTN
jgi:16S rRNA (guanine527-N7)-methyltransferase